jgi:hypothetical protein
VAAAEVKRRRARCAIPDAVRHREKWRLALDMLDEITGDWGLPRRPVVADAGYGDTTAFRLGLTERGLDYMVAVKPTTSAHPGDAIPEQPAYAGRSRRPAPGYPEDPQNLRTLALAAGRRALRQVTWRRGTLKSKANPAAKMKSRFLALRVRPANRDIPHASDGSLPECWLLAEWPPVNPNPPITGCPPSMPTPRSRPWYAWPRSAGGSSTTTANSSTAWGWTTSKAAATSAGTGTSPSPQ